MKQPVIRSREDRDRELAVAEKALETETSLLKRYHWEQWIDYLQKWQPQRLVLHGREVLDDE